MAIVDLGTLVLTGTSTPLSFAPFSFNDNRAYQVFFDILVQSPNLVFSELQINPLITLNDGREFYYNQEFLLDPFISPRSILLPMTPLFDDNGVCTIQINRQNIIRTGGDGGSITVNATYDDNADIRTWLR